MTRWFNPGLLGKLLGQVVMADLFGQYADRRLVHAALDSVPDQAVRERADLSAAPDPQAGDGEAVWIDYVADLGDGFDATYAIASLLGAERLQVDGHDLPRGRALVMGGDEVYPTASYRAYKDRLVTPYAWALPDREGAPHPSLFMIPGNHDWYDGLDSFLALFCRRKPTAVGLWRTPQRRSYFAARLTGDLWLWGIDIALTENMDQPQADYFIAVAEAMPQGAGIILCIAEPGWYGADKKSASYRILTYAAKLAANAGRDLRIPLVLSGDTHHYCRYAGDAGTHFITSGGGGAFLHGTHQLKDAIAVDWMRGPPSTLSLRTGPGPDHPPVDERACYPTMAESRALLGGNLRFPLLNWDFALLLGGLFAVLAFPLTMAWRADLGVGCVAVLVAGLVAYAAYQEPGRRLALALAGGHGVVQGLALVGLAAAARALDAAGPRLMDGPWWGWAAVLGLVMVSLGGLVSSALFGLNLYLTCRYADLNHNDAFSAMRLDSHRHFLRIRITAAELTIYPVCLDRVPKRGDWVMEA
ncbi:MAG: metallophosphoesterase [Actinomycetospora chiangmaiensis]|nr:metallophosphoesterase [Actinomycetospora chiangmaiensis]